MLDHGDRNLKAAGAVLLAVSTQLVWGPIFFQLFTPELLKADAALVGTATDGDAARCCLVQHDLLRARTVMPFRLIAACSSFNNVSSAVLACVAVTMLRRNEWVRRDLPPSSSPASR